MKFVSPRGHVVSTSIYILVVAHLMNFDILVKTRKSALLRVKNMRGFADDFIYSNVKPSIRTFSNTRSYHCKDETSNAFIDEQS